MKTTSMKSLFGKLAIAGAFMAIPVSTYALDTTTNASVDINRDGIIRVMGAEVTSISGSVINAVANFKNTLINLAFTTNASTTLNTSVNGTATTSLAGLSAGDKINVAGTLGSLGSIIGINATNVREVGSTTKATSTVKTGVKVGTVQSVNTQNGTFVLKSDDKLITVQTTSGTQFMMGTTTLSLATLPVNTKILVTGTMTSSTTMTATHIVAKADVKDLVKKIKKDVHNNGKGNDDNHFFMSKLRAWFNW